MSKLRVLIVGASIAGPMAAYWFAKAGASVTIIERFPQLRKGGQNIDIRTVGVTVMRKMLGLEEAVLAKKTSMEGLSLVRADGRPYGTITATGDPYQQSLVSEYEIFRGDLSQILFDMTKDNKDITYVFAEQVASIQQHKKESGPVQVEFYNGYPTSEFDLVVACDGATSRSRAIGLGCGVRDHIHPTNCWVAYCSVQKDLLEGGKIAQAYTAVGGRALGIGPDSPGVNRLVFMGIHPRSDRDAMEPFREVLRRGEVAVKKYVSKHFGGIGWKTEEAIAAMMETTDFYASETVQVKPPSLSRGRFVMVGDAGYATGPTGTGTSLAMAGAYILAGELAKSKGNLEAALKGYEAKMRPLIADLQKIPLLVPEVFAPYTSWGLWLRNTIFAFVCWTRVLEFTQKFFGEPSTNTEKHKLPNYEWES